MSVLVCAFPPCIILYIIVMPSSHPVWKGCSIVRTSRASLIRVSFTTVFLDTAMHHTYASGSEVARRIVAGRVEVKVGLGQ